MNYIALGIRSSDNMCCVIYSNDSFESIENTFLTHSEYYNAYDYGGCSTIDYTLNKLGAKMTGRELPYNGTYSGSNNNFGIINHFDFHFDILKEIVPINLDLAIDSLTMEIDSLWGVLTEKRMRLKELINAKEM